MQQWHQVMVLSSYYETNLSCNKGSVVYETCTYYCNTFSFGVIDRSVIISAFSFGVY